LLCKEKSAKVVLMQLALALAVMVRIFTTGLPSIR
jgi:hypothetical protein